MRRQKQEEEELEEGWSKITFGFHFLFQLHQSVSYVGMKRNKDRVGLVIGEKARNVVDADGFRLCILSFCENGCTVMSSAANR